MVMETTDKKHKRRPWTAEEDKLLMELYPTHFASELEDILDRSAPSIYTRVDKLGIKSPLAKIQRAARMSAHHPNSRRYQFPKGAVPHNKGKKMSPEQYEKCKATMFKKGNETHNKKPVGTERICRDGWIEVKVADPGTWKAKHRIVWEEAHGEIPKGYKVVFKNGDRKDVRLENLELISHAELMIRNSMHTNYPEELRHIMLLKGVLRRKIRELSNHE